MEYGIRVCICKII